MTRSESTNRLLITAKDALRAGDESEAFRLVDRARRISPRDHGLTLLSGKLLLSHGEVASALAILDDLPEHARTIETEATALEACLILGPDDRAISRLDKALRHFAVGLDGPLAALATRFQDRTGDDWRGWVGISPRLELVGVLPASSSARHLSIRSLTGLLVVEKVIAASPGEPVPFLISTGDIGRQSQLAISVDGTALIGGGPLPYPPDFRLRGGIEIADGALTGWAKFGWDPHYEPSISLRSSNELVAQMDARFEGASDRWVFSFADASIEEASSLVVESTQPDGRLVPLPGSPYRKREVARTADAPADSALNTMRRLLSENRLARGGREHVLLVTHALSGGVARHIRDRCETLRKDGLEPLVLRPDGPGSSDMRLVSDDPTVATLRYSVGERSRLKKFLARLRIRHAELHHFYDLDPLFVEAVAAGGWPYDVYVHDFIWYCPRIVLLDGDFRYCGEPGLAGCEACIATNGSQLSEAISVTELRQRSGRWLAGARKVLVPSQSTADRMRRQFPEVALTISGWEATASTTRRTPSRSRARTRIAVIGAIGKSKGYDMLLGLAQDAAARALPLDFSVIGYTEDDDRLMETGHAFVTGEYREDEVAAIIDREDPLIALFLSIWPETWSYTLTHALSAGLPICALDIGAIAERLRMSDGDYHLFPLDIEVEALNDRLLQIIQGVAPTTATSTPSSLQPLALSGEQVPKNLNGIPMKPNPTELNASVQTLSLNEGLYLFSVRSASPTRMAGNDAMVLPAVHVTPCPGGPSSHVEFLSGGGENDRWLFDRGHLLVVKITSGPAVLLLTSLRAQNLAPLDIEVKSLNAPDEPADLAQAAVSKKPRTSIEEPRLPPVEGSIRLQVVTHVRNRGDVPFPDGAWAGVLGEGLWIESFSVVPLEKLNPGDLEYKGLTATGVESPWVSGGAPCGTKGKGVALVGFAVRVKPQADGTRYECSYSAAFLSGARIGPMTDGDPCVSDHQHDPLEAISVTIFAKSEVRSADEPAPASVLESPADEKSRRTPIGPRFSVFRESADTHLG